MIIEFNVENFLSFKEKKTISLLASKDISLEDNLIRTEVLKKDDLLKSAIIYGANASGKTNLIKAIGEMKNLVLYSHQFQKGTKLRYIPFLLDEKNHSLPTKFEIAFIKNNIRYLYGFSYNSDRIVNEYLYYYPKGKKSVIFERKRTNNYYFTNDKKDQDFIADRTLDNVLYLSNSTKLNYQKTTPAFEWFKDNLRVIGPDDHRNLDQFTADLLMKNKDLNKFVLNALIIADLGINDFSFTSQEINLNDIPNWVRERMEEHIKFIKEKRKAELEKIVEINIKTGHKFLKKNGGVDKIFFNIDQESEGTKRIFSLMGPWIDALLNGRVLFVDELDTKLHHLLNIFLINLFHDPSQNKKNAQVVLTTHNTNLLDQDIFRRDQIWFTEKDPEEESTDLYSLLEFKPMPRKDKDLQKGYLAGRYGALPFIKLHKVLE